VKSQSCDFIRLFFKLQSFVGPRYPPGGPRPDVRLTQVGNEFNGGRIVKTELTLLLANLFLGFWVCLQLPECV
jgi:hypothetical protein